MFSRFVLELELPVDGDKLGGFGDTPYLGEGEVLYLGEALADFEGKEILRFTNEYKFEIT